MTTDRFIIKIWLFSTYDFSFNNYLISEHYVSELIYVTLSFGGNPQPECIKVVSFVEYGNWRDYYLLIGVNKSRFWALFAIFDILGLKKGRGPTGTPMGLGAQNPTKK